MLSLQILFLVFAIAAAQTTNLTLLAERMIATQVWVQRSNSSAQMYLAFTDQYSTEDVYHIVRDTADYGPREVALEYDLVVLDLIYVFGFNPVELTSYWDPSTVKWLDEDTIQTNFNTDLRSEYNFTTGWYDIDETGFRNTDIYVFAPNTSRVILAYSIQDDSAIAAFAVGQAATTNEEICGFFLFPSCAPEYQNLTGYSSIADCVAYLDSLGADPCPYAVRSNTPSCRLTHSWAAGLLPSVHCPHTGKGNLSVTCIDTCLPACADCHADATCVPTYPTLFTPVYQCQCKNGYVGNGSYCEPDYCEPGNICSDALYGSYNCTNNLCTCADTFTHDPTGLSGDLCACPSPSTIIWQGSSPICVPEGKCIDQQWECGIQSYNQVQCIPPGNNTFTRWKACVCNYGFLGGYEYPCLCPSPKRDLWSPAHNGEVCLTATECTTGWHCNSQVCNVPTGSLIGTCAP